MRNFNLDDLYTYTSPVFWIMVILMLVSKLLIGIFSWSTIGDWYVILFRLKSWEDYKLYGAIEVRKIRRDDKTSIKYWNKTLAFNTGARKAISILRERNKARRSPILTAHRKSLLYT